jgi:tRNA dimethylallyltransferase
VRRQQLELLSTAALQEYCTQNNIPLPENNQNKRYLIRAIEQQGVNNKRRHEPLSNSIIVGIATDRDVLRTRIESRAEQLFTDGVVEEATMLGKRYGWRSEAMTGNIYPLVRRHLSGELSLEEMKQKFITLDWRLAKRQLTWLRRNSHITWLPLEEAQRFLVQKLAK